MEFLQQIPFLKYQTQNQLRSLISSFNDKVINLNQYLFMQDQSPSNVYIIKEGEFQIIRRERKQSDANQEDDTATLNFTKNRRGSNIADDYDDGSGFAPAQEIKTIASPFFSKGRKVDTVQLKVGTASTGAVLGFNDVLFNRTHIVSVRCISVKAVVKVIKADEFISKMQRDPATWEVLNIFADERDMDIEESIHKSMYNINQILKKSSPN